MSLNSLLNISKQGILVSQGSLHTVSHNISNVNTPGYSRQTVQQEGVPGNSQDPGGSGVKMDEITRQIDQLVDRRQQLGTGELGRLETRDQYLGMVEQVFNDMDDSGLSKQLEAFYAKADALTSNPTNPVAREDFVAQANALAQTIQKMQKSLGDITLPIDKEITTTLDDVNTRLKAIRDINKTIVANENSNPALDLKDQRSQMVLDLGKIIDIQTLPTAQDGLKIMTSRGQQTIADEVYAATLTRSPKVNAEGFQGITINSREYGDSDHIRGGKLGGLLEIRDQIIHGQNGVMTKLNTLTDELRWQVNRVSSQTVSQTMYQSQTGIFELGQDLTTPVKGQYPALKNVVTNSKDPNYKDTPKGVARVVDGSITFASGDTTDNLTLSQPVAITRDMSIVDIAKAINQSGTVNASFATEGDQQYLQISAKKAGGVFGVVSDSSGILAALGIGAIFGGRSGEDIQVNQTLLNDSKQLGAAQLTVTNGAVTFDDANAKGAVALGNLRTTKFTIDGQNATLTNHYAEVTGDLGSLVSQNKDSLTAQKSSQDFIANLRSSVSGVSLEEELTDLLKYQRAFQASSKMVSIADELMQSLISMV
ncbi:MAG: flagellar hook-associated protein FlgK [Magnetococcales bacterium]|nr:flagellar hook-associated protein FlgK [Magnetococcales bacterium]